MSHHYRRLLRRPWVGFPSRGAQHRAVTAVPPFLPFLFLFFTPFLSPSFSFLLLASSFCSRSTHDPGVRERSTGLLPKTPFHSPPFHSPFRRLSDVKNPSPPSLWVPDGLSRGSFSSVLPNTLERINRVENRTVDALITAPCRRPSSLLAGQVPVSGVLLRVLLPFLLRCVPLRYVPPMIVLMRVKYTPRQ